MIQAGLYPNPTIGYETNPNNNNTGSATSRGLHRSGDQDRGQADPRGRGGADGPAQRGAGLEAGSLAIWPPRSGVTTTLSWSPRKRSASTEAWPTSPTRFSGCKPTCWGAGSPPATSRRPCGPRPSSFASRYKQSIANYIYAWKQLVADMGLRQLPLSAVEGQVDRLIPYYDYDAVLAHVLRNHTDVLTARATWQGARLQPQAGPGHSRARRRGACATS